MPIDLVSQLVSAAIRAFGLGLVAFVGLWLFRIRSSAARHATWTVVLAGMLLQIPLGVVAPAVPLKALPTLPAPIQPRAMESGANVRSGSANTRAGESHAHGAEGPRVSSSGTLTGLYLAISMLLFFRMALGSWGLRRILRDAKPIARPGSRCLRIGLIGGARFGRVLPGEDSSAASLEGLGRRKASSRSRS